MNQKASRWVGILILLMLVFRLGRLLYQSQRPPDAEVQLTDIEARVQALSDSIDNNQDDLRARGAPVVVADSAVLAVDTAVKQARK